MQEENLADTSHIREEIKTLEKQFAQAHGNKAEEIEVDILNRENKIREIERGRERREILNRSKKIEQEHPSLAERLRRMGLVQNTMGQSDEAAEKQQGEPVVPINHEELGEESVLEKIAAASPEDPPLTIHPEGFEARKTVHPESRTEFTGEQAAFAEGVNKNIYERLSASGRKVWETMSDEARYLFQRAQETVVGAPGEILGRFQLAYHQLWAGRHETQATRLKAKMDGLDLAIRDLGNSARSLESNVAHIRAQNLPGAERSELAVKTLELSQRKLLNKKDKLQSKFEARENRRNLFINKRDALANKFIHTYNARLEPMESELENFSLQRDRLELLEAVKETQWREQSEILDNIAHTAQENPSLKELWEIVAEGRAKINKERTCFNKRRTEIGGGIAKIDRRANLYRDKRDQFERIKQGRPVEMNVETRVRVPYVEMGPEPVSPHPRGQEYSPFETSPSSGTDASSSLEKGLSQERLRGHAVSEYITGWFARMHERGARVGAESFGVDEARAFTREFLRSTGYAESSRLLSQEIRNVMEKYLRIAYRDRRGAGEVTERREVLLKGLDEFLQTQENQ
ncbi:MAG: hypothetical protein B7X04_04390 [Parcubacteria group bacterium 21-54-25]|nr:MAG: hypothetical protein B7X04_04390 [Parcubacteria group bacterium 21-54-25]